MQFQWYSCDEYYMLTMYNINNVCKFSFAVQMCFNKAELTFELNCSMLRVNLSISQ